MRPSLKILIIAIAVLLVGLLIYFVWQGLSDETGPDPEPGATSTLPLVPIAPPVKEFPSEIPGTTGATLRRLSDEAVFDYWANSSGEASYMTPNGNVFLAKPAADTNVSQESVETPIRLIPNSDGTRALVSFGNPLAPSWRLFDGIDNTWRPLPEELRNATWGVKPTEIIGVIEKDTNSSLVVFDYTKTPFTYSVIQKSFRFHDVSLFLTGLETLLVSEKPSFYTEGRLWSLDLKTQKLSLIIQGQRGTLLGWDPKHKTLFSFSGPNQFSILDEKLSLRIPSVFSTFPSKCASSANSSAYCFVPRKLSTPENKVTLPDDYLMKRFYSEDDLYSVSEESGTTKVDLGDISLFPTIDATHTSFSSGKLFFVNRYDSRLYELTLPQ